MKLGKSATETFGMLSQVSGEHYLSLAVVFEWHSRFEAGQVLSEDDKCSGRPSISKTIGNVEKN
jgi:hypothetical protein